LPLVRRQLEGSAELDAFRHGAVPTIACPLADQLALELGQTTENRQHQPAMRRGRIGPGIG
jgi:hypothetical protein